MPPRCKYYGTASGCKRAQCPFFHAKPCPSYKADTTKEKCYADKAHQEAKENALERTSRLSPPICKYFMAGMCKFGKECNQLHSQADGDFVEKEWFGESPVVAPNAPPPQASFAQHLEYLVVLDFEGAEEVIEMPALLMKRSADGQTFSEVKNGNSRFHQWIRPLELFQKQKTEFPNSSVNENSNTLTLDVALLRLHTFLYHHGLVLGENGKTKNDSLIPMWAFVTCGQWDLIKHLPRQCVLHGISRPSYFDRIVNIKSLYNSATGGNVTGMKGLLKTLSLPLIGCHHLGN